MTVIDDIATEYLYWPDPKAVTLTHKRHVTAGANQVESITHAARLDMETARRLFGQMNLRSDETVWVIPNSLLDDISELAPGDEIHVDATGDNYTISSVSRVKADTQWICRTTKER